MTRALIIQAAIACLHEVGYAATTTALVAQRGGVSRGALAHHFPTKTDLILAVAEWIYADDQAQYRRGLRAIEDPADRFREMLRLAWPMFAGPKGLAMLEIMVGAHSDPELNARYPEVRARIERTSRANMWAMAQAAGVTDREAIHQLSTVSIAALRGLAIDYMFLRDRRALRGAFELLDALRTRTFLELIEKPGPNTPS